MNAQPPEHAPSPEGDLESVKIPSSDSDVAPQDGDLDQISGAARKGIEEKLQQSSGELFPDGLRELLENSRT